MEFGFDNITKISVILGTMQFRFEIVCQAINLSMYLKIKKVSLKYSSLNKKWKKYVYS